MTLWVLTLQIGAYLSGNHHVAQECTPIESDIVPLTEPFTEENDSDKVNDYRLTEVNDYEDSTSNLDDWVEDEMSIPEIEIDDNLYMEAPYQDEDCELPHNLTINDDGPSLYPNSKLTTVQAVSILTSWFSAFPGTSKRSFSRLLKILFFQKEIHFQHPMLRQLVCSNHI